MICNGQLIAYFTCQSDQSYASFSIYWRKKATLWINCGINLSSEVVKSIWPDALFWERAIIISDVCLSLKKDSSVFICDVFMGCSRLESSCHISKRGGILLILCLLMHNVSVAMLDFKASCEVFSASSQNCWCWFYFWAPIFTLCWLCCLEEFAVQYLAQGADCRDLISYHRSSNKSRTDPFEALPSPHLLSCEHNTGKGMLQYTFVDFFFL